MSRRIVIVNPNSTAAVTRGISEAVEPLRRPDGPVIDCITLAEGPPGIETKEHIDAVVPPLLGRLKREAADASVIACFSDPGLKAARAASKRPVFGIGESAFRRALLQGKRFGILAILEASTHRHRRYIAELGLTQSFIGSRPLDLGVLELQERERSFARMLAVGRVLRDEDRADVLVLGCAGMTGYCIDLSEALGLPVVEPCQAAAAEALASLG
ncbi:Asp/Glu racemase [Pelagibius litoralis]|uniref:Asp/Glu racemase n=1 Tax=Pelagibius litoralis TaxID=374515 RepID=A0A967K8T3_9PROT|nr:aspartate/glutamate racemase family protein [Pelagibius litoralis]NIA70633.1 Asp/Glu racemase [Pelagibius litoralis]